MSYQYIQVPENGEKITFSNGSINVPNNPIIPFIEGDGIGPDIWASAVRVLDAAVEKAYNGDKKTPSSSLANSGGVISKPRASTFRRISLGSCGYCKQTDIKV